MANHDGSKKFKEPSGFTRIASDFPIKRISNDAAFFGLLPSKQGVRGNNSVKYYEKIPSISR
jgi:hypothetical protein